MLFSCSGDTRAVSTCGSMKFARRLRSCLIFWTICAGSVTKLLPMRPISSSDIRLPRCGTATKMTRLMNSLRLKLSSLLSSASRSDGKDSPRSVLPNIFSHSASPLSETAVRVNSPPMLCASTIASSSLGLRRSGSKVRNNSSILSRTCWPK